MRPQLYDLVALGGTVATRARFDVRLLTPRFAIPPRSLLLVTHRSDWDVPLVCNAYWPARLWGARRRPVFVARDDMLLPGFLAGFTPGLPLVLRRALARLDVGGILRGHGLALPVVNASRAHLVELAREQPSLPLDALPFADADALRSRAHHLRRREPTTLADVAGGGYVDLLWHRFGRDEVPAAEEFWARRAAAARRALETLIEHVAGGGSLVVFPEGHPSPDGAVHRLERGLGLLVRRAAPELLIPAGIAYDPFGAGRTRAYLAVGEPFAPPGRATEEEVLAALRRTLPLTPGAVAAHAHLHGLVPLRVAEEALAEPGRPHEPRLAELLPDAVAGARAAVRPALERLDLEFRSARAA